MNSNEILKWTKYLEKNIALGKDTQDAPPTLKKVAFTKGAL